MHYLLRFDFFIFDSYFFIFDSYFHFQYSNSSVCFPISHVPGQKGFFTHSTIFSRSLSVFSSVFHCSGYSQCSITSIFFAFSFPSTFGVILPNFQITIIFFLSYKMFTFFSHKLFLFVQPPNEWKMMIIR